MDKISIIVPVYNVEQYLSRCINSLTGQTYKNIEILIVDDCSKDKSANIIKHYAQVDSRIRPFFQNYNQGVSSSRNLALNEMTGDWVCFCDGDDWYEADFLEKMLNCAKKENADYVICNYQLAYDNSPPIISNSLAGIINNYDVKTVIACGPTSSCTHMIKKQLFEKGNVRYPIGLKQYEELPVIPLLAKHAQKIALVNEPLYNYYQRGNATSASNISDNSEQNFFTSCSILSNALGKGYEDELEYLAIYALFYGEILKLCKNKANTKVIKQKICQYEEKFPNYINNKYLFKLGFSKTIFVKLSHYRCIIGLRLLAWIHKKIVK